MHKITPRGLPRRLLSSFWLGLVAFFAGACCQADTVVGSLSEATSRFSSGALKAVFTLSFVVGVVCLLMAFDRFKKHLDSPVENALSIAILYTIFGLVLIALYFLA